MPNSARINGPRDPLIDDEAVFRQVTHPSTLDAAWTRVFTNAGAAGGDGVSVRRFLANAPLRLSRLRQALVSGDYVPGPIRRVSIPKSDGSARILTIPSVIDRVAQTAVQQVLSPLIDQELEDSSFAYRAGRSVQQAVGRIQALRASGHLFLVDADIDDFFDTVPHDTLMTRLAETMTDGPTTHLIALWLEHAGTIGRGLAQGSPLSPLLANLYLDRLDEAFAQRGSAIVRFADDFVILTTSRSDAEAALGKAKRLLSDHGLALNIDKTRVTSFDQGFRFLGTLFVRSMVMAGQREDPSPDADRLLRALADSDAQRDARAQEAEAVAERERDHGLDPVQRILYITSPDRRLALRNQAFSVQAGSSLPDGGTEWHEVLALPHSRVDRIELGPDGSAVMPALRHAMATDTPIAFVNGHGETLGWVAPRMGQRGPRHLAQARHILDEDARLALARCFVDARIRNHRALLRRLNRERQEPSVTPALAGLNAAVRGIGKPASIPALMGLEGRATALFWPAFGRLLDGGFAFRKREREAPADGVNILLNVTANLLARDIAVALDRVGLHPGFGVLHSSQDGTDAAVFDLIEEFRAPLSESVVAQAVNGKSLTEADFEARDDGGVRLRSSGYTKVVRAYERAVAREVKSQRDGRRRGWRGIMTDQALCLADHVEGRGTYRPYVLDY